MGRRMRDPLLLLGALLASAVLFIGAFESARWVGRPFPGFLVLRNQVVASAGLGHWPAIQDGGIYQTELVGVEGKVLQDPRDLRGILSSHGSGEALEYRFRTDDEVFTRRIEVRTFRVLDYVLLFGAYMFCGIGLVVVALTIRFLGPREPGARGSSFALWIVGMWALTAMDIYGPYRLFRMHALFECLLFAGILHLALVFPTVPRKVQRQGRLAFVPYLTAAPLVIWNQLVLFDPAGYTRSHTTAVAAFGCALLVWIASLVRAWVRPQSFVARQRVKVLALGAVAALGPQVLLTLASASTGGQASENLMGWSGIFFPLAMGYAVLKNDLLHVDAILRRTVTYALLTVVLGGVYASGVVAIQGWIGGAPGMGPAAQILLFAGVAGVVLLPLRDRAQGMVDRLFFRSAYDFRRLVEDTSARLASCLDPDAVRRDIEGVVLEALSPETCELRVIERDPEGAPNAIQRRDGPSSSSPVDTEEGGLSVPFLAAGRIVGWLVLGRRLSGRLYGGEDRRLLATLANQGAVALERAVAWRRLWELNRTLEQKVSERTAELTNTLDELRRTQRQLVHQEKMASIGQVVAGVAHEINNPLNFIAGNLYHLRGYARALQDGLSAYEEAAKTEPRFADSIAEIRKRLELDEVREDVEPALSGCDEGVRRATSIVTALRTFSRLDSGQVAAKDLVQSIDATVKLLHGRLRRVQVEREFESLPMVECLGGQIDQVLLNLVANAADAVGDGGRIVLRAQRIGSERVAIEVEDDGYGIPEEKLDRIFDPFFTTKKVGKGTGLGLAISYEVINHHGGLLQVDSEEGRGSRFRMELPVSFVGGDASGSSGGEGGR